MANADQNNEKRNKPLSDRKEGDASDREFPGYPHYPASEDILNPANGARQVPADPDTINRANPFVQNETNLPVDPMAAANTGDGTEDDLQIVQGTEADVTSDDLVSLGPRDRDMDMGDDEVLRGKLPQLGEAEDAIDVPGAELDDDNEELGEEDEENNYYSLGGDRQDKNEEDPASSY